MEVYGNEAKERVLLMDELKVDTKNWKVYYYERDKQQFWVLDYPDSESQGGGIARLRALNVVPKEIEILAVFDGL